MLTTITRRDSLEPSFAARATPVLEPSAMTRRDSGARPDTSKTGQRIVRVKDRDGRRIDLHQSQGDIIVLDDGNTYLTLKGQLRIDAVEGYRIAAKYLVGRI